MARNQPAGMWGFSLGVATRLGAPPVAAGRAAAAAAAAASAWPGPPTLPPTPVSASTTSTLPSLCPSAGVAWRDDTSPAAPTRLPSPAALLKSVCRQAGSGGGGLVGGGGGIGKAPWVRDRRMDVASLLSPAASPPARRPATPYLPVATAAGSGAVGWATRTAAAEEPPRTSDNLQGGGAPPPSSGGTTRTRCTVCAKVLSSRTNMLRHVRVVHERSQVLRCGRCPSAFLYACQLKLHTATVHHKRRPFPCAVCGRGFGTRGHAKEHLQLVHEKRRPFGCGRCDKRCRTRALLAAHTSAAHGGDGAEGVETVGGEAPAPAVASQPAAATLPVAPPSAWAYGRAPGTDGTAPVWATAGPSYEGAMRAPIASR